MNSPNFSDFRPLLDLWDNIKDKFNKKCLVEDNQLTFFFKKDKVIYGASENSRLTFARMKNPDPEEKKWSKEANFSAYNLEEEKPGKVLFGTKDLEKIKVIDQESAEKALENKGKEMPAIPGTGDEMDEN